MQKNNSPEKLISDCTRFMDQHQLVTPNSTVIIGFSGGPDSVFLLHLLASLKSSRNLMLIAAHLDHGWRENSAQDVLFCKKLADSYGVLFVDGHARDFARNSPKENSLEAQGRALRRAFFESVMHTHNANTIALGHHADDQLETFFIRLTRGAGVTGLAGILPYNKPYIHPLLNSRKQSILDFLTTQQIPYLVDPTNTDRRFLRNRIRHDVIPTLCKTDQRFMETTQKTINLLQKTGDFIAFETEKALTSISHPVNNTLIDYKKLLMLHPFLRDQVILEWIIRSGVPFSPSQELLKEIVRFFGNTKSSSHTIYQSWCITKKQWYAYIESC